jgi:hypothetical protein
MNMTLANSQSLGRAYALFLTKSFLVWVFTFIVCSLVIGFPILILVVGIGALLAVTLQSVMPMSSVLLVAGGTLALHILGVMLASAVLTLKGVHPQDVSWLTWLNGKADEAETPSVYASCPFTCGVTKL